MNVAEHRGPYATQLIARIPLVGALIAAPTAVPAQVRVRVDIGGDRGPAIGVVAYSSARERDWPGSYRRWTPVTLYYGADRRYYRQPYRDDRRYTDERTRSRGHDRR